MRQMTAAQRDLLQQAAQIANALRSAETRLDNLRDERITAMKSLFSAGVSWAEIGRTFGVSPQAAMYATGHTTRQGAKKPVKKG